MIRLFKIGDQTRNPEFDIGLLNQNSVKKPLKSNWKIEKKNVTIAIYDIA